MFETVELNLIPKGEPPIVHVSQYDVGRIIRFLITNDGEAIDFFGTIKEIKITIRKVDSNLIVYEAYPELVAGKVELVTNEQITACAGNNIGEITIVFNNPPTTGDDDASISTLNFIMNVEKSPECGGIESQSEIANLDNQIAGIVDEQLDNYYTKSEIDSQIETIVTEQVTPIVAGIVEEQVPPAVEAELSNYYDKDDIDTYFYNKSETDTLLSGKANRTDLPDMTDYYTKSDTDTLLAGKVSTSTLNDYYNKTQVDNLIAGVSTDFTTSINTPAAIQTFSDGGDNIPMKSCIVAIPASGTGFNSVSVAVVGGKNLFGGSDGVNYPLIIPANKTFTLSCSAGGGKFEYFRKDGTLIDYYFFSSTQSRTITCPETIYSVTLTVVTTPYVNAQIEFNNVATTYEPFISNNIYTISLGETLTQGGKLDMVSGLLTRTDTTTSQLTGVNIPTLSGTNNVYADSGNINSLEYFNDKGDDIASMIRLITR